MTLLNLLKSLNIRSNPRVGDTKKELQRIGHCRGPMIIPVGLLDSKNNQTGWGVVRLADILSLVRFYRHYKLVISDNNGNNTVELEN